MKTAEYKLVALRETAAPSEMVVGDAPDKVADYWRNQVTKSAAYNPDVENLCVIFLNTRRRITGHVYISTGSMDTLLVAPREVFRAAIVHGAAAIVIGHNHPSGESSPSEADVKVTRDLIRGGQLLKVEVLDHVIIGHPTENKGYSSLRELGYFYS